MKGCLKKIAAGMSGVAIAGGAVSLATVTGCREPRGPISINSDDPDLKILAIERDVRTRSRTDFPGMVAGLSDDDSAIRFYCFQGLQRLTGNDFGYHFYDGPEQRAPAVARWQQWLAGKR